MRANGETKKVIDALLANIEKMRGEKLNEEFVVVCDQDAFDRLRELCGSVILIQTDHRDLMKNSVGTFNGCDVFIENISLQARKTIMVMPRETYKEIFCAPRTHFANFSKRDIKLEDEND